MALTLLIMASLLLFGVLSSIAMVGKQRRPLTGGTVAVMVAFNLTWATVLVLAALNGVEPW